MSHYKLIIFDFDGTLCATHEAVLFCIQQAYKTLHITVPATDFIDTTIRLALGTEKTLKILTPELADHQIQHLLDCYEAIYLAEAEPKSTLFSKVDEVLAQLYAVGFILIIVSNKATAAIHAALERFQLKQYIALVIGDSKALQKKPDPMAYTDFIQPTFKEIQRQEILMIGDTSADLLFAQNIGASSCWVTYGYGDAKACLALNPTYSISHLTAILAILL